jgi:hypothetical protein
MGKDRSGKYHPPKGKPSGAGKEEGLGIHPTEPDKLDEYLDISDRYTTDEDEIAPHVPVRHPNRNTEKGHDRFKNQQDAQESRKSDKHAIDEEGPVAAPEELPSILTKEQFSELANFKDGTCVSIYLPTNATGVEGNERFDPTIFRQSLQQAADQLSRKGRSKEEIDSLLQPGHALAGDETFWTNMTKGLVIFLADGYFKYMKLPVATEADVVVERSFFVTPLIQLIVKDEHYYLLVISKKQVKLFRGDAFGMQFIPVPGLPQGMEDAQADDKDEETTFRTGGRGGTGGANFHGIGGGNNVDDKAKIATYLEAADDIIWKEFLHNETAPLLLAGVEYLIPIYKSVTDYKHVYTEAMTGSHERDDLPTLYKKSMEIMAPYFRQRLEKALALYGNQSATPLTAWVIKDIVPAAYYGRVAYLFVQKGTHVWGTFDEMSNELKLYGTGGEEEDLLDNAVAKTLQNGGEVFLVDKEEMPADSPLAAIFRY